MHWTDRLAIAASVASAGTLWLMNKQRKLNFYNTQNTKNNFRKSFSSSYLRC